MLIKPIKVEQLVGDAALAVDNVRADGTVMLKPIYVGSELVGAPDYASQRSAFVHDWFEDADGGAGSISPQSGQKEEINGQKYEWRPLESEGGYMDLQKDNPGGKGLNWVIAYAYTEIEVDRPMRAYIGMGSDDVARVWLNGNLVHEVWANRPARPDEDIVPVKLTAGKNRLLVKVQNFLMPNWGLYLHFFLPRK